MQKPFDLCTNREEVFRELCLTADELTPENLSSSSFIRKRLRLTYPVSDIIDPFTLVKDIERKGRYTPIDNGLLEVVLHLNNVGIRTRFCCEGHFQDDTPLSGNLMFDIPENPSNALSDALSALKEKGFVIQGFPSNKINILWFFNTPEEKSEKLSILKDILLSLK